MDELMLDGNAVAGLLQEVFAVEMTTAIGTCGNCGATEAETQAYLKRWGLMTPKFAAHMIRFFTEPTSRTYIITYPAGRELCRSYVAGEPERFHRLLTEQVRVRDLLEARNAGAARR